MIFCTPFRRRSWACPTHPYIVACNGPGVSRLPVVKDGKRSKRQFNVYPIDYFDIVEARIIGA